MTDNHSIIPPLELVQQWLGAYFGITVTGEVSEVEHALATQAARWGADQELNECCKWLPKLPPWSADDLRKHRRPQPPSLKEQALAALAEADGADYPVVCTTLTADQHALIRRALETLPE